MCCDGFQTGDTGPVPFVLDPDYVSETASLFRNRDFSDLELEGFIASLRLVLLTGWKQYSHDHVTCKY